MRISVIVVTYNQQDTLARTLDSILSQRIDELFEIVIGDDCSTDGTETVARRYAALYPDRITYLRRDRNMGVAANYFDCIAHARGEFLADCAGDDFWVDNHKLARERDYLDAHPDVTLVATDWLCRDEESGRLSRSPLNPEVKEVMEYAAGELCIPILTHRISPHLCTAMFRKSVLEEAMRNHPAKYTDPMFSCEDQQILLTMASEGKIAILPGVTLHYSVGHSSVSHPADYARKFEYSMRAMRQSLILQHHFNLDGREVRRHTARTLNHVAAMALRAGTEEDKLRGDRRNARLRRFICRRNLNVPPKAKLYMTLMKMPSLWKIINRLQS